VDLLATIAIIVIPAMLAMSLSITRSVKETFLAMGVIFAMGAMVVGVMLAVGALLG
jgi:hypothetical protein